MQVKICGVRTIEGALACAQAGVRFAGLNFVDGARRSVSVERASTLVPLLADTEAVAVFQNASVEAISRTTEALGIRWVQLHGSEPPSMCRQLSADLTVIKAFSLEQVCTPGALSAYADAAAVFLVDSKTPGSGQSWDWTAVNLANGRLEDTPVYLAGGLNADNVARAILAAQPTGVDTASGVESPDGQLCPKRIRAFCRAVRAQSIEGKSS